MAIISRSVDDEPMSDINVTPLVDVMLVLLTVFIVTAPLLMNTVQVKLPRTAPTAALDTLHNVRVSITAEGGVFLNRRRLAAGSLEAELRRLRAAGEVSVEILGDERVPYREVARVMAQIQRAGIAKFAFVLLPENPPAARP